MKDIRLEGYTIEEYETEESFSIIVVGHPIIVCGKTKESAYKNTSEILSEYAEGKLTINNNSFLIDIEDEEVAVHDSVISRICELAGVNENEIRKKGKDINRISIKRL